MRHFVWPRVLAGWPGASKLARVGAHASAGEGSGHGVGELTVELRMRVGMGQWMVGFRGVCWREIRGEEQREEEMNGWEVATRGLRELGRSYSMQPMARHAIILS